MHLIEWAIKYVYKNYIYIFIFSYCYISCIQSTHSLQLILIVITLLHSSLIHYFVVSIQISSIPFIIHATRYTLHATCYIPHTIDYLVHGIHGIHDTSIIAHDIPKRTITTTTTITKPSLKFQMPFVRKRNLNIHIHILIFLHTCTITHTHAHTKTMKKKGKKKHYIVSLDTKSHRTPVNHQSSIIVPICHLPSTHQEKKKKTT